MISVTYSKCFREKNVVFSIYGWESTCVKGQLKLYTGFLSRWLMPLSACVVQGSTLCIFSQMWLTVNKCRISVKHLWEFLVLFSQLFCKFKRISKWKVPPNVLNDVGVRENKVYEHDDPLKFVGLVHTYVWGRGDNTERASQGSQERRYKHLN